MKGSVGRGRIATTRFRDFFADFFLPYFSYSRFSASPFPSFHCVCVCPQVIGTLRDQLIYPHSVAQMRALGVTDADLVNLLQVGPAFGTMFRFSQRIGFFVSMDLFT